MIRRMTIEDREKFCTMAELFYASDAVLQPIPKEHHIHTFDEMMLSDCYLEGYIFEYHKKPAGYALLAKTYSHEAGGITVWIDELFVMEEYRSKGLGKAFFKHLKSTLDPSVVRVRLEVESNNERAIGFYHKLGFEEIQYGQLFKDRPEEPQEDSDE